MIFIARDDALLSPPLLAAAITFLLPPMPAYASLPPLSAAIFFARHAAIDFFFFFSLRPLPIIMMPPRAMSIRHIIENTCFRQLISLRHAIFDMAIFTFAACHLLLFSPPCLLSPPLPPFATRAPPLFIFR